MKYYAELLNGERKPITEMVYQILLSIYGWEHVIRDTNLTIIKGRNHV